MAGNIYDQIDPVGGSGASATAAPAPSPNPYDRIDPLTPAPAAAAPATPVPAESAPAGSWWSRVAWPNLQYIGGRLGMGVLEGAQALGQNEYQAEAGAIGGAAGVPPWQSVNPSQVMFGTPQPPTAPSTTAQYVGAVGEALGQNPVLGAGFPLTTAAGAAGGELGQQLGGTPGRIIGSLAAGGLAGVGAGLAKSLTAWKSGDLGLLAGMSGDSKTLEEAGTMVKGLAQDAISSKSAVMDELYKPVWSELDQLYPGGKPLVPLTNVESTLRDILRLDSRDPTAQAMAREAGGGAAWKQWQILSGQKGPQAPGFLPPPRGKIVAPGPTSPEDLESAASGGGGSIPSIALRGISAEPNSIPAQNLGTAYQGMRQMGEGMTDSAIKGMGEANVARLYRAYQDDFRNYFERFGLDEAWDHANNQASLFNRDLENHLQPIANASTSAGAAKAAMQGANAGGERLQVVQDLLGKRATDELAAAHLVQTPKAWSKLAPEAKEVLVPDPAQRGRIDAAVGDLGKKPVGIGEMIGASVAPITSGEVFGGPLGRLMGGESGHDLGQIAAGAAPILGYVAARQPKYLPNVAIGGLAGAGNLLTGLGDGSGR